MRTGIERLAWFLGQEDPDLTMGQLAKKYDEPISRIMDALDVLKIRHGVATQIPPVKWSP